MCFCPNVVFVSVLCLSSAACARACASTAHGRVMSTESGQLLLPAHTSAGLRTSIDHYTQAPVTNAHRCIVFADQVDGFTVQFGGMHGFKW